MTPILIALIKIYRVAVSPLFAPVCRFEPTCSTYAIDAIRTHGPLRGMWLGVKRIGKCHPFHRGGYDPVPEPQSGK